MARRSRFSIAGCLAGVLLFLAGATGRAIPADGECPPEPSRPCFPGAGYRKAVSSVGPWSGIEAVVTLPTPCFDPDRLRPGTARPLDSASVYLGGRAGDREVDCGLNWEVIREPDGRVSSTGKAYRIFWRVDSWNSGPARPEYYFYPGDTVRLACRTTTEPGKLCLEVSLLARAAEPVPTTALGKGGARVVWAPFDPVAAKNAQEADWGTTGTEARVPQPLSSFRIVFDAPGFGPGRAQEFKRVNALDQSGNEGRPVQPTRTRITGAVWREVYLLRGTDKLERVAMTPCRFTDMRCPFPECVRVTPFGESGERVDLLGIAPPKGLERPDGAWTQAGSTGSLTAR